MFYNYVQLSLYASSYFQICGILTVLTSDCASITEFTPHVIFSVSWRRICDLTETVIDKTLAALSCVIIRALYIVYYMKC